MTTDVLTDGELDALVEEGRRGAAAIHYLSRTEAAYRLGLKSLRSLNGVELPPHDAEVGERKGWLPETIDAWKEARPGRGWWGAREMPSSGPKKVEGQTRKKSKKKAKVRASAD